MKITQPLLLCSAPEDLTTIQYPVFVWPKYDGIRCLIINGVAYSRKLIPIPNIYVQEMAKDLPVDCDGELVGSTYDETQSIVMSKDKDASSLTYKMFDIIHLTTPYSDRVHFLPNKEDVDYARDAEELKSMFDRAIKLGYEGVVIRSYDGLYKQGRSTQKEGIAMKLKPKKDAEAIITGFNQLYTNKNEKELDNTGKTKRSTKKQNLVVQNKVGAIIADFNGVEIHLGTGLTDTQREVMWENQQDFIGKRVTFEYMELTKNGKPRFPVFKAVREID